MQLPTCRTAVSIAALTFFASAAQASAPPISGFWRMNVPIEAPKPLLTTKARADMAKVQINPPDTDKGLDNRCVLQGMPHVLDSAGPIDIIQGETEVVISAEKLSHFRHIYIDGRKHVSDDLFDHSSMGDSIGHWRGNSLMVETVGFSKGVGPFGAPLTDNTHLIETFKVVGDMLSVTSTWTDKFTFAKPFIYTLVYDRVQGAYTADNYYCDPRNNGFFLPGTLR
jgi:hypothetical protein